MISVSDFATVVRRTRNRAKTQDVKFCVELCMTDEEYDLFNEFLGEQADREYEARQLTDGFGNYWSKTCPLCGQDTMEVVRPGKVQCGGCG